MTSIRPLAESDRDDWLPLWLAYLEFYETELGDEQTALAEERERLEAAWLEASEALEG